jgi:hypothetical protein
MAPDDFDLEKLRVTPEVLAAAAKARGAGQSSPSPRRQPRPQFTKFPHSWEERLRSVHSADVYRLALFLLFQHWKSTGKPVVVSNVALVKQGVLAKQKWRALRTLEGLGLIRVEGRPGRSPRVTLLLG